MSVTLTSIRTQIKTLQQEQRNGGDRERIRQELANLRVLEDAAWRVSVGLPERPYA